MVEDIETSYWGASAVYGYKLDSRQPADNLIAQMMPAVDAVNSEFLSNSRLDAISAHPLAEILADIEMISLATTA